MKTVFVACCSPEYLSRYRVLYASIKKHVLEVDTILYYGDSNLPNDVGMVLDASQWVRDSKYTNAFYTYCHMRTKAVLDAFERGYDKVVLLGADTEFFDYPIKALEALDDNDMFVTMYAHEPYPEAEANIFGNDLQVLENGQINADFIGFRKSDKVIKFVKWVIKQTEHNCQVGQKVYVDQAYWSMAFSYLDNVKVLRELGYNVGSYNVVPRGLTKFNGQWIMRDNSSLVLYHYDGFIKEQPQRISGHQNRFQADGLLLKFLNDYASKI